jgi:hypothetical protein
VPAPPLLIVSLLLEQATFPGTVEQSSAVAAQMVAFRFGATGMEEVMPLVEFHCLGIVCPTPATQKPPAMHIVPRLPRKRGGAQQEAEPQGRQGGHPTPWQ